MNPRELPPLVLVGGLVAALWLTARFDVVRVPVGAGGPCPARPMHARPVAFHFSPGFEEHQSWIEARVPEPDATDFVLCLDGAVLAEHIGQTPENGVVQASVRTTWTNVQWLVGALDPLAQPDRWDLGYTTYTFENRRPRSQPVLNTS
ncbi:MAG: hypothetical protein NVSMB2_06270 [Chloroflexota bacterium]